MICSDVGSASSGGKVSVGVNGTKRVVDVDELPYLSTGERRLVLKYAGGDVLYGCAGHAVYQLDGKRKGQYGAEDLMMRALIDWDSRGDPWLLQERLRSPFEITYFDDDKRELATESMRARIMPCYSVFDGKSQLIAASALFNRSWKVHGNSQSVFCPMIER